MSQDMRTFQQELRYECLCCCRLKLTFVCSSISSESAPSTAWSRGSEESWGRVKRGLNGSLAQFGTLSDKYKEKACSLFFNDIQSINFTYKGFSRVRGLV